MEIHVDDNNEVDVDVVPLSPRRSFHTTHTRPGWLNDFVLTTQPSSVSYPFGKYLNYAALDSQNQCYLSSITKHTEPNTFHETTYDSHWMTAMQDELKALEDNHTWSLVPLPPNKWAIG